MARGAPTTAAPALRALLAAGLLGAGLAACAASGGAGGRSSAVGPSTSAGAPAPSDASSTEAPSGAADGDSGAGGAPTVPGGVVGPAARRPGPAACRPGDPLADVYHPDRLRVLSPCRTVTGVVMTVRHEQDGDTHFDVALDPPYASLLTAANRRYQHGWLVAEIVPADEPGCTPGTPPRAAHGSYDYGTCTGADVPDPAVGAHVAVTGPAVLDEDHEGWAEIHPVWAVGTGR